MSSRFRLGKLIICGLTTGVAAAAVVYKSNGVPDDLLPTALASWTTNFSPSTKWDYNWDKREPASLLAPNKTEVDGAEYSAKLQKLKPTATRHLILIRHGHYNVDGLTDEKRILTALGREQADFTGKRLKELNHPYTIMYNSTMARAKETSDIIAQHLPNVQRDECDMLREGAPIPPEPPVGHWKPEIRDGRVHPDVSVKTMRMIFKATVEGMTLNVQTFYEDGARIEAAFRKYFHRASPEQSEDSFEVMVCHANVIRYFACRAMQFPPEAWLRISLNHASITWLAIRPSGRVSLRQLGDSGHIPPSKLSAS